METDTDQPGLQRRELTIRVRFALTGQDLGEVHLGDTDTFASLLHAVSILTKAPADEASDGISSLRLLLNGKLLPSESHLSLRKVGISDGVLLEVVRYHGLPLATASADHTARIWNTESGACERSLAGHLDAVTCVAATADGSLLATSSHDFSVILWSTETGERFETLSGHTGTVQSVAFSWDGSCLASASRDAVSLIWDTSSGRCLEVLQGHRDTLNDVCFHPTDEFVATASGDETLKVWERSSRAAPLTFSGHGGPVCSVVFSTDGSKILSSSRDLTAKVWCFHTRACLVNFLGHTGPLNRAVFSPAGGLVATASDDATVKLWNAEGDCLGTLEGDVPFSSASFSPEGCYLVTACGVKAQVWQVQSLQSLLTLEGHQGPILSAMFVPQVSGPLQA